MKADRTLSNGSAIIRAQMAVGRAAFAVGGADPTKRVHGFIESLLCVQYDPIATVAPSHVITSFARDHSLINTQVEKAFSPESGTIEGWVRVACFLTRYDYLAMGPEITRRRQGPLRYGERVRVGDDIEALATRFMTAIETIGPATAREVVAHLEFDQRRVGTWKTSVARTVLNYLWYRGYITITGRAKMEPSFDLVSRVFPDHPFDTTRDDAQAHHQLICDWSLRLLNGLVAATVSEIAWHLGQAVPIVRAAIAELEAQEDVMRFLLSGESQPIYCRPENWERLRSMADEPASDESPALLSPFDPILAHRDRFERLSGIKFRADLFTPSTERSAAAFYPLIVMQDDLPVGKIWLRADRSAGQLVKLGFQPLPPHKARRGSVDHAAKQLAGFLGLRFVKERRGS